MTGCLINEASVIVVYFICHWRKPSGNSNLTKLALTTSTLLMYTIQIGLLLQSIYGTILIPYAWFKFPFPFPTCSLSELSVLAPVLITSCPGILNSHCCQFLTVTHTVQWTCAARMRLITVQDESFTVLIRQGQSYTQTQKCVQCVCVWVN